MAIAEYNNLTIVRQTKGGIPILPFVHMKEALLGKKYDLSVVFPTLADSEELHLQWKKKPGPVNILSFPLDETSGEIILTLSQARKEASKHGHSYHNHLIFLFIHGCLHLKGMTHGAKMEKEERFFCKKFFI
jgi:probable rRNA maturation factor